MWNLFATHKDLEYKVDILLTIDSLEHSLTISYEVVFLHNLNKNIANIFNDDFASLVSAFFLTGLKFSPYLIKQQFYYL